MDVLILTCGTGGGHNAAASAIAEELTRRGHRAVILNPYTLRSGRLAERIDRTYIALAQRAPTLFGAVYCAGELYDKLPCRSPVYFINRKMIPVMEDYLSRESFDVVIMTHLFPAEIMTGMKERGLSIPRTVFVATDYVCIPFTEETDCAAYVIPSAELVGEYARRGLPEERLCPLGIPVAACFSREESKPAARERLGLDPDKRYILAAGGSMGGGKLGKAIRLLAREVAGRPGTELIVVCGSNEKLCGELKSLALPGVTALGFTPDMAGYLTAADLFVTKPGGLSSTEAAVRGTPTVHVAAIPGCESFNARFFSERGMSVHCGTTRRGLSEALELLDDEAARDGMIECQKRHIHPDAAARIAELAEEMGKYE